MASGATTDASLAPGVHPGPFPGAALLPGVGGAGQFPADPGVTGVGEEIAPVVDRRRAVIQFVEEVAVVVAAGPHRLPVVAHQHGPVPESGVGLLVPVVGIGGRQ
jgi:hypothetical protein